jgi:hypothetical protein
LLGSKPALEETLYDDIVPSEEVGLMTAVD